LDHSLQLLLVSFNLIVLYLLALPNTPENLFASIYNEPLIKTTRQHLLLLVGFDTLIYRKYYDTPPILLGHHSTTTSAARAAPGSIGGAGGAAPAQRSAPPTSP
jgi:hypothetical protein